MINEIFHVTLPIKTYDMSKSDSWTQEQWDEWHDYPSHYEDRSFLLLETDELRLAHGSTFYNERTSCMYYEFKYDNKTSEEVALSLTEWQMDGQVRELADQTVVHIPPSSENVIFKKGIKFPVMGDWTEAKLTFWQLEPQSNEVLRSFTIVITRVPVQIF